MAGLSTTNAAAFKVKSISFENGELVLEWDSDLNAGGTKSDRADKLLGKHSLSETNWTDLSDATNVDATGWRFFRVGVELEE